ncbi:MAG: NUDIX domain-containing protein, partial [Proteobacteria bacterium]|nr:NUDIX domain-containing protein [Pseudomonadota bacterium]
MTRAKGARLSRRVGRLGAAVFHYARIAWWGLVSPRLPASEPLVVLQAVVCDGDRVLLSVRSDLRGWELPGGTLEAGESDEEALVREVFEETGLRVQVESRVGDYVRTGFRPHTARIFRCRVASGALAPSHETPVVRWFERDRLPATLLPWYRGPLTDAFAAEAPVERHERLGLQ